MDEKTEELRDIFIDVTDEDTVTESQEEARGSLIDREGIRDRLEGVVESMRERYGFSTDLTDDELCRLVHAYYDGVTDAEIARELDVSRSTVMRARLDLHLVRDRDRDAPFDLDDLRECLEGDPSVAELAEAFEVSRSTVRRYRRVVGVEDRSRAANNRYRDEFDEILADAGLSTDMAESVREDGLEDATEGMETDVSF
ncbi:conditioned medium-induced protein 4 [Halobacteriales archaeon QS_8_69_26]|nr:MAG: conditioned medium-induced protein 4 [Halobacteriales archaeon QS_8_69_26]